jgi:hypothetical protein
MGFQHVVAAWTALAVVVGFLLFLITVPYGRHARKGWGPLLLDKWAWLIGGEWGDAANVLLYL